LTNIVLNKCLAQTILNKLETLLNIYGPSIKTMSINQRVYYHTGLTVFNT